jgi:rod shape determining protein RodA
VARNETLIGKIDWITVLLYGILVLFGWIMIYSSVYTDAGKSIFDTSTNSGKQFEWIITSVIIAFIILIIDSRFYVTFSYPIYALFMAVTISVIFFGVAVKGHRNWIHVGSFTLQPSELAKFAASLALAKYLSGLHVDIRKWRDKWKAFAIIGLPILLVLAEGDAGSAIVFVVFVLVLFREGLEAYYLIVGAIVIVLSLLALLINPVIIAVILTLIAGFVLYQLRKRKLTWYITGIYLLALGYVFSVNYGFNKVLKPHQKDRINVLLGKQVENGKDWNIRQSIIAIGSGGFLGKGYLNGTQTKLKFVPEQSTDFIFSSIGEEFGFIGSTMLALVYISLFFRLLFLAERQRSKYSRIYGYCVVSILFFHFMINMGMAIGVAPVIGIPLPFISYGGSSLLSFTLLLFVFIRLDTQRFEVMR